MEPVQEIGDVIESEKCSRLQLTDRNLTLLGSSNAHGETRSRNKLYMSVRPQENAVRTRCYEYAE